MNHKAGLEHDLFVIYDKECPLCNRFACAAVRTPTLHLLNGRENPALLGQAKTKGLDIDRGIIVSYKNELHFGADALELIARKVAFTGPTKFLLRLVARYQWLAKLLYPLMAVSRRQLLKILGRPLINIPR
ncbi:MAG: DCC1-like thiol-disulfide oxidoreductase family protein [Cellvibrionaceae bacterium]